MIEEWGTEIALVIATVVGVFVMSVGRDEFSKTKTGRWFQFLVPALIMISVAMYFGLRMSGINP
jgi:cytosine/uracil/thiamine/allantoin permease